MLRNREASGGQSGGQDGSGADQSLALLDGDRARNAIGPRKPRTRVRCFGYATPAEATPESTSAVLGALAGTDHPRSLPHRASHRADEVENVVLVACIDQLPK
jgi:hypothetical protein